MKGLRIDVVDHHPAEGVEKSKRKEKLEGARYLSSEGGSRIKWKELPKALVLNCDRIPSSNRRIGRHFRTFHPVS